MARFTSKSKPCASRPHQQRQPMLHQLRIAASELLSAFCQYDKTLL